MTENSVSTDSSRANPAPDRIRAGTVAAALLVAAVSGWVILSGLASQPHFADESANIAGSYYYQLYRKGDWDHPDWLHYAAYDHPPLPKYLVGASLELRGLPVPSTLGPWINWMIHRDFSPPGDPRVLYWARVPAALCGVAGVLGVFFIGLHVGGRLLGMIAALLLLINPLYLTEARRATPDVFTECMVIGSVALGLWGWKELWSDSLRWQRWIVLIVLQSALCGLAVASKLNGTIALAVALATLALGGLVSGYRRIAPDPAQSRPAVGNLVIAPLAALGISCGTFLVFLALNPFLTARPPLGPDHPDEMHRTAAMGVFARLQYLFDFRYQWAEQAKQSEVFRKDRLETFADRLRMTFWEGFGRFSPLGPRDIQTHEPRPDRERLGDYRRLTALVWFPLVLLGLAAALRDGWTRARSGQVAHSWGLLLYTAAALAGIVMLIPLNWDRYYLPMQPCAAVLVPLGIVRACRGVIQRLVLRPPQPLEVERRDEEVSV